MIEIYDSPELACCIEALRSNGFVPMATLCNVAKLFNKYGELASSLIALSEAFNGAGDVIANLDKELSNGNFVAAAVRQFLTDNEIDCQPFENISQKRFVDLRAKLLNNSEKFITEELSKSCYPYYSPGRTYGYKPDWVNGVLRDAKQMFKRFSNSRRSDTAILVGNGPSLNRIDFDVLHGQDVYISNYAIKSQEIAKHAKGVAVTNHLVAEQEPFWFSLNNIWKFHPLWLGYTLPYTNTTIFLNALGGELFFSKDITTKIAWHSTVTFFWLQILYSAGYRKVVMTGFDHYYHQKENAKEGDLLKQTDDDQNHFDPNYFKGKVWQAADVSKMEETYLLAKNYYEADGREIVNATIDGHLEIFRRSELSKEIERPRIFGRIARPDLKPKVAIITAFWKSDFAQAQLHWRLINRLGIPSVDHIYLFKHHKDILPPTTLPRVVCADIENEYPEAAKLPHPAGPNLVFVQTIKMLIETQYTHFFWLEPDCIPTDKDWLKPFLDRLEEYPDEPIIGTGGGTVTPGALYWRNHFAGCSLYSLKHLAEVDWDSFIKNHLNVSFDSWLSVNLGYIQLGNVNNSDKTTTIIFGKDRYEWSEERRPDSLVYGMFEHWRPEKIMTADQLEERLSWPSFSLYHAVKDREVVVRLFKTLAKSASTIIINYNNERYLFDAIESALNQKINDIQYYEVIVVDDGSNDSSKSIIESFGDRIKAIYLPHGMLNGNFNQQRALKAGLDIAKGEILLLLDGDDIFYPDKVQTVCEMFDDPDVVLVQHTLTLIDGDGMPMEKVFKAFPSVTIKPETYQKLKRVNLYQATSGLAFCRSYIKSQLEKLCVDEHANTWLDVRLTRFAPYYGKVYCSDKRLGAWRRHKKSDSIRTDNVVDRVKGHEIWFDEVSSKEGFPAVPFKWKESLIGPYLRDDHAHWDESLGIQRFTMSNNSGIMIDVGAHQGYALMPFLNSGWRVFAFEPDNSNRNKLLERLKTNKNKHLVVIDSRCVSNKSLNGVSFYTSEQSTGISGLSAFHESHHESQKVDVITLTEFFEDKPMPDVDFLKIDTEGHDLFVLQGYPWARGKPRIIECEFEDVKTVPLGYSFHDLARFLKDKGYKVYVSEWHPIVRYGIQHDWRQLMRYPCELSDKKGWGNFIAFIDPIEERTFVDTVTHMLNVDAIQNVNPSFIDDTDESPLQLGFITYAGPNFKNTGCNHWHYSHSDGEQKLWWAVKDTNGKTAGAEFVGGFRLQAEYPMTVNVSLCSHGTSEYEATTKLVNLLPGVYQHIRLKKAFKQSHLSLKLQVEVIDLDCSNANEITIDEIYLHESLENIRNRVSKSNISLRWANNLFRKGDYGTAMGIYLLLHLKRESLNIYQNNALMAARKLGAPIVGSLNDLLERFGF